MPQTDAVNRMTNATMTPNDRDAIPNGHCIPGNDALDVVRNRSL